MRSFKHFSSVVILYPSAPSALTPEQIKARWGAAAASLLYLLCSSLFYRRTYKALQYLPTQTEKNRHDRKRKRDRKSVRAEIHSFLFLCIIYNPTTATLSFLPPSRLHSFASLSSYSLKARS